MTNEELPLFVHWQKVIGDILDRTQKFPKAVRFTFSTRIDGAALDVLEGIVEARYSHGPRKTEALRRIDLALARLRVLLRLSHDRQYVDSGGYEHVARGLDEAGRMVGGWRKEAGSR